VILPGDIDDRATPSGGNTYDRRMCQQLALAGWRVREHAVPGGWPDAGATGRVRLGDTLASIPDDGLVLLDGLVASAVPELLVPQSQRLRLVVLVHMPLDDEAEGVALAAARAIVTTSDWTRQRLLARYPLAADRVHVARPGVDPAPLAPGSPAGTQLLCVAAVTPPKGYDLLAEALAKIAELPWRCEWVGSLARDPGFVARLHRQLDGYGLAHRIQLTGARTGAELAATYAGADLLVLASRGETYGMVLTEALARGIPVLASEVGGVPEALGHAPGGSRPGLLVPPEDPGALAGALRRWLTGPDLRARLRQAAQDRRDTLTGWAATGAAISTALATA
jgi:glycosyltransferase involved in cell wall biosynthesis